MKTDFYIQQRKLRHFSHSSGELEVFDDYYFDDKYNIVRVKTGTVVSQQTNDKGYKTVRLLANGVQYVRKVSRLILSTFKAIDYVFKYEASHIDESRDNDSIDNLIWENATSNRLRPKKRIRSSKVVYKYFMNGLLAKVYQPIVDCKKDGFYDSSVCRAASGKAAHHKGFIWSYHKLTVNEVLERADIARNSKKKKVAVCYPDIASIWREFDSVNEAASFIGVKPNSISRCLSNGKYRAGGYFFKEI